MNSAISEPGLDRQLCHRSQYCSKLKMIFTKSSFPLPSHLCSWIFHKVFTLCSNKRFFSVLCFSARLSFENFSRLVRCSVIDQSYASTYSKGQDIHWKAKTNMAEGMTQHCDLCKRLRLSLHWHIKSKNMTAVVQLILASLTGVAVALIATYLPSIWRPWFGRPSLESYAPGFNLVLAPQKALEEKRKFCSFLLLPYIWVDFVGERSATLNLKAVGFFL